MNSLKTPIIRMVRFTCSVSETGCVLYYTKFCFIQKSRWGTSYQRWTHWMYIYIYICTCTYLLTLINDRHYFAHNNLLEISWHRMSYSRHRMIYSFIENFRFIHFLQDAKLYLWNLRFSTGCTSTKATVRTQRGNKMIKKKKIPHSRNSSKI